MEFICANVVNPDQYPNFAIKLVALATSLEELEKEVRIDDLQKYL